MKLKAFDDYELTDINAVAEKYTAALSGIVKTPVIPDGFYSSWSQYTIQLEDKATRDRLQAALKAEGIPSMVYYPKPMHRQEAFVGQDHDDADFPNTMRLCDTVLSLPMHPYLGDEDVEMVVRVIEGSL